MHCKKNRKTHITEKRSIIGPPPLPWPGSPPKKEKKMKKKGQEIFCSSTIHRARGGTDPRLGGGKTRAGGASERAGAGEHLGTMSAPPQDTGDVELFDDLFGHFREARVFDAPPAVGNTEAEQTEPPKVGPQAPLPGIPKAAPPFRSTMQWPARPRHPPESLAHSRSRPTHARNGESTHLTHLLYSLSPNPRSTR